MTVKIRFFARFRELLGNDIITDVDAGKMFTPLITTYCTRKIPKVMLPSSMRTGPSASL